MSNILSKKINSFFKRILPIFALSAILSTAYSNITVLADEIFVDSDPFDIVGVPVECDVLRPCVIYPREQTFTPPTNEAERWRDADLTFKVNGTSSGEGNHLPDIGTGAECFFRIRRFEKLGSDLTEGYNAILEELRTVPENNPKRVEDMVGGPIDPETGMETGNGTIDTLVYDYDLDDGCGITIPADLQEFVDWQINVTVVSPDGVAYQASPAYFFKYGVVGVTFIR